MVKKLASRLAKGSRKTFPKGSLYAVGEAGLHEHADGQNVTLKAGSMGLALQRAIRNFEDEFGRPPMFGRVLFRGRFYTHQTTIEICEEPDDV